jgi:hypothetical protein
MRSGETAWADENDSDRSHRRFRSRKKSVPTLRDKAIYARYFVRHDEREARFINPYLQTQIIKLQLLPHKGK